MAELINGFTPEQIKTSLRLCPDDPVDCQSCPYDLSFTCRDTAMSNALNYIERLEADRDAALAKVPKWISVEERLPEENRTVLVYADGCASIAEVYDRDMITGEAVWSYTGLGCAPWYWMPLPEPPKEDA